MGNHLERYLYDKIKSYKTKICEREKEKTKIQKMSIEKYQINMLIKIEKDFIVHYKNRIEKMEMIFKDEDFVYNVGLLISTNIMKDTHIYYILNAYWKLQDFNDAKIDIKNYATIKKKNPDIPDSPAIIRRALTEELRFAHYSDKNVRDIMKVVIGRASRFARKQDQKMSNGRTIHTILFSSTIE